MYNTLFDPAKLERFHITNHNAVSDSNLALVRSLESCTADPAQFDHSGHVQLAWTYLRLHPPRQALGECIGTIRRFAEHAGARDKFHSTITLANFLAVVSSMAESDNSETWPAFMRRNTELIRHPLNAVYRLYTHERLHSEEAQSQFLAPDGEHRF